MFTRKQKGVMDQQDFPDLDPAASKGNKGSEQAAGSKASGPMMFSGMSAAKGPRDAPQEESKGSGPKMPIFKGKAKLNTGPTAVSDSKGPSTNYDFSRMGMSAATTGKRAEGGAAGEQKGDGERRRPAAKAQFSDDEDFEVVREKKKPQRRQFDGDSAFGGGKPSFTRGGGNRDQ